jgi:amino acid transporter
LQKGALGLRELLFQSIAHMAPAGGVAFSIPIGAAFAGGALPLSVLLALGACLLTATCMGRLARDLPSAGSFAAYAYHGIHPTAGFLTAWAYAFLEPLVAPGANLILALALADSLHAAVGMSAGLWPAYLVAATGIQTLVGLSHVRAAGRLTVWLGALEVLVFAALALTLVARAPAAVDLQVFTPAAAQAPGFSGLSGVLAGSVYALVAFTGFEAAAPMAEEAHAPRRTIPAAVIGSATVIGVFYVGVTYAATIFYGPSRMPTFFSTLNPLQDLARAVWGAGAVLILLAIIKSGIANAVAGQNAATRTLYALGRARVLPAALARLDPTRHSPAVAVAVQTVIGLTLPIALGLAYNPQTALSFLLTVPVVLVIAIYMVVSVAALLYPIRSGRRPAGALAWFRHVVVPVGALIVLVPAFLAAAGIPVARFVQRLPAPLSYAGPIDGAWVAIGVIVFLRLRRRYPERIRAVGQVFAG